MLTPFPDSQICSQRGYVPPINIAGWGTTLVLPEEDVLKRLILGDPINHL